MKIFVTGGAGFIGSNFVRYMLDAREDVSIVNFDKLTYAGNLGNLADLSEHSRYRFVRGDISDFEQVDSQIGDCCTIVNFAAESHVDRSILDSSDFLTTNVEGTRVLLEVSRKRRIARFLQVSTDEVYGSLGKEGRFSESTPLAPNSPYAASKAAADLFVRSYHKTYGLNTVITRCTNNFGPFQFPEKLIPLMILNASEGQTLPVYGDGLNVRDWIHVQDHCRALEVVIERGRPGEVYNIGASEEKTNLEVIQQILKQLDRPESLIEFVRDRPGHDRRYAIDSSKIRKELGWTPTVQFEGGLEATIQWYLQNLDWVAQIRSGDYRDYYRRLYDQRNDTLANL